MPKTEAKLRKLPDGHMRARMEIVIEGPLQQSVERIADIIKALPQEERPKAVRKFKAALNAARRT